jgi:hypothetical protein
MEVGTYATSQRRDCAIGQKRDAIFERIKKMKTMKFRKHLSEQILAGTKTTTWRLFDDKDFRAGDHVSFVVWETGELFAQAQLMRVVEKCLDQVNEKDWHGHDRYASNGEMYRAFMQYYKKPVGPKERVKIITFELL